MKTVSHLMLVSLAERSKEDELPKGSYVRFPGDIAGYAQDFWSLLTPEQLETLERSGLFSTEQWAAFVAIFMACLRHEKDLRAVEGLIRSFAEASALRAMERELGGSRDLKLVPMPPVPKAEKDTP